MSVSYDYRNYYSVMVDKDIETLIDSASIITSYDICKTQIQPASLDLRLSRHAWRIKASFLPGTHCTVENAFEMFCIEKIDLSNGYVLEKGYVYLIQLAESLHLPKHIHAVSNAKSSTGRLDIFTRLISDGATEFDKVVAGYHGPLFLEVSPLTFSIIVRDGSCLSQIRFITQIQQSIVEPMILPIHVSLRPDCVNQAIAFKAKHKTYPIDIDCIRTYDPYEFWDPYFYDNKECMILDPGEFYILASSDIVSIPPMWSAELLPFNASVGEFRVHYAGFFDPGFGNAKAVLEMRCRDVPFVLKDRQKIGDLHYHPLSQHPRHLYGNDIQSNYQSQGLKLSKHFYEDNKKN